MRYVILGTAGHIDHGKSSLVKAMTGIDPDRLKEEKERGITIDLGFADLEYPDGLKVGIVDVPGHERLIRNMLAGAGGIDIVLLVIAGDEGIMPQTKEHLYICDLLNIKSGIIAITKADLVEPEWIELIRDEIRGFVKGTFLESAEIIPVSAKTGYNLDSLKEKIRQVSMDIKPKPVDGIFRLPIDRVFTLKGFGTVVTGTAVSGTVSLEDTVEILPSRLISKIRGLHSHGRHIKTAYAGQRVALNLQGIEKEALKRGDTLISPHRLAPTSVIDVKLQMLKTSPLLKTRTLVHFHTGTSETIGRCILYGRNELLGGESSYCQIRLKDTVVTQSGDRYIIRRFSPLETIGGGSVLDPCPSKRKKSEAIDDLRVFEEGSLDEKIALKIKKAGLHAMSKEMVGGWIKAGISSIDDALNALKRKGLLIQIEDMLLHRHAVDSFQEAVIGRLRDFHKNNLFKAGISKEELRTFLRIEPKTFGSLISMIDGILIESETVRLKDFKIVLSDRDKTKILDIIARGGFQPPMKTELSAMLSMNETEMNDMLNHLQKEGSVVRISDALYLGASCYKNMLDLLGEFFKKKPEMTVSEFRDLLNTSRKYAVPYLEYMDSNKITLRVGDIRKLFLKGKERQ